MRDLGRNIVEWWSLSLGFLQQTTKIIDQWFITAILVCGKISKAGELSRPEMLRSWEVIDASWCKNMKNIQGLGQLMKPCTGKIDFLKKIPELTGLEHWISSKDLNACNCSGLGGFLAALSMIERKPPHKMVALCYEEHSKNSSCVGFLCRWAPRVFHGCKNRTQYTELYVKRVIHFVLFVSKMEGHDLWELSVSVILSKICLPESLL